MCVFFPGGRHGGSKDPLEEERESEGEENEYNRRGRVSDELDAVARVDLRSREMVERPGGAFFVMVVQLLLGSLRHQ